MSITSSSTVAQIEAEYLDNASYEEDDSVAKCKAFITACRALLVVRPQETGKGQSGTLKFNLELLKGQLEDARRWLATNPELVDDSVSCVKHVDFADFRE